MHSVQLHACVCLILGWINIPPRFANVGFKETGPPCAHCRSAERLGYILFLNRDRISIQLSRSNSSSLISHTSISAIMPFSMHLRSPTQPGLPNRQRRLSSEETNRMILISRRKSSDEASLRDRNLRVYLGHAHIAETLKHEFINVDQPQYETRPDPILRPQRIRWADSLSQRSDSTKDATLAIEDDGEEDFDSLTLVRTPSRAAQSPRDDIMTTPICQSHG
jgi:hypothetical protein